MYRVLARKWRPQTFQDVIGQDHIVRVLVNALTYNRVAHGYIFSGLRGIGKTSLTRIFSCALNCEKKSLGQVLCDCSSCVQIREGRHMDVFEIDGASHNSVDDVREIEEAASFSPSSGIHKIYIIDEVHMLSRAAFNALLKTLEEPPDHVKFMMATTEIEKVPDTIRSRCQLLALRPLSYESVRMQCQKILDAEERQVPAEILHDISRLSEGSVRDALSLLDQALCSLDNQTSDIEDFFQILGIVSTQTILKLVQHLIDGKLGLFFEELSGVMASGVSASSLLSKLIFLTRQMMIYSSIGSQAEGLLQVTSDEKPLVVEVSSLLTQEEWLLWLQMMIKAEDQMKMVSLESVVLEMLAIKLSRFCDLVFLNSKLTASSSQSSLIVKKKLNQDITPQKSSLSSQSFVQSQGLSSSDVSKKTSVERPSSVENNQKNIHLSVQEAPSSKASLSSKQQEPSTLSQESVLSKVSLSSKQDTPSSVLQEQTVLSQKSSPQIEHATLSLEDSVRHFLIESVKDEKPMLSGCLSCVHISVKDNKVQMEVASDRPFDYKTLSREDYLKSIKKLVFDRFEYELNVIQSTSLNHVDKPSLSTQPVTLKDSEEIKYLKKRLGAQVISYENHSKSATPPL